METKKLNEYLEKLNEYLSNYLKNDKTGRAILLTSPWGSGKSYYIKNELCPYLEERKLTYAVVSLYGLQDIKELNKSLYLELRTPKYIKNMHKEGKAWGKTILKGVASFLNINLNADEKDLENLYKSIDLKDKLIIFEDVERSGIDLIEFLGYVNNLVETDGIKILLVANEEELLKNEKKEKYILVKEKTVGDTIKFHSQLETITTSLYSNFAKENKYLKELCNHDIIAKINNIMVKNESNNYRLLLYALQKILDVFNQLNDKEYNIYFLENAILGTIEYITSENFKPNQNLNDLFLSHTNNPNYHLYWFMMEYIHEQAFSKDSIHIAEKAYLRHQENLELSENLNIIYGYLNCKEEKIVPALDIIYHQLEQNKGVPCEEYLRLANYLIAIASILESEKINKCLSYMLNNLKEGQMEKSQFTTLYSGIILESEEERKKFDKFKKEFKSIIIRRLFSFEYTIEGIKEFLSNFSDINLSSSNFSAIDFKDGFANKFDIDKLLQLLKQCDPETIDKLRGRFISVYTADIKNMFENDKENLEKLIDGIEEIIRTNNGNLDKIQIKQLEYFVLNLQDIFKDYNAEY